jgi:biopolymer transport protein ExbD
MKFLRNTKRSPEIPSASMADVAFLLITFFMLTTAIAMTRGIFYKVPEVQQDQTEQDKKNPAIYLYVDPTGNLLIDGKLSHLQDIVPYCKDKLNINQNKPVIVDCNENQNYQKMMDVLDQVKKAEEQLWGDYNKDKSENQKKRIKITIPSSEEADLYRPQ